MANRVPRHQRQRNIYFGASHQDNQAYFALLGLEDSGISLAELVKVVLIQIGSGSLELDYNPLQIRENGKNDLMAGLMEKIDEIHQKLQNGTILAPSGVPEGKPSHGVIENKRVRNAFASFDD